MKGVLAILTVALLCPATMGESKLLSTRETVVTRLVENIADTGFAVSPDSRHVAFCAKPAERWGVYLDGKAGAFFSSVTEPVFSPNSGSILYGGQPKQGEGWQVLAVSMGNAPTVESTFDLLAVRGYAFSPDSKRKAVIGVKGGKWLIVVDGVTHTFDAYSPDTLAFSPDSRHVAWVARDGKEFFPYIDGNAAGGSCGKSAALAWSADSRRVAFRANRGGAYAATAGIEGVAPLAAGATFDGLLDDTPTLSHDGEHLAFGGLRKGRWCVVLDGKESKPFDLIGKQSIRIVGGKVVAVVSSNKKWRVLHGDAELPGEYDLLASPAVSPDGMHWALAARLGAAWTLVVDGKARPESFDQIGATTLAFPPDGEHLAFAARRGKIWNVYRDGVAVGGAYAEMAAAPVAFAADARHVAFTAGKANGKWVLVCDGRESQEFESFLRGSHPTFSADGQTLGTLAVVKGNVVRVEATVGK